MHLIFYISLSEIKMNSAFVENVKSKLKLLPANKGKNQKKKQKKKAGEETEMRPGVVYVGHIPRGFYEKEMRAYFSQFGKVLRLRLARSSRTGGSKGFAFIEFESEEVAKVVAETMNNYLFFEKLLKCEFIPSDKVHPNAFKGWTQRMPLRHETNRVVHNKDKNKQQVEKSKEKRFKRLQKLRSSLKDSGITLKINRFRPNKSL